MKILVLYASAEAKISSSTAAYVVVRAENELHHPTTYFVIDQALNPLFHVHTVSGVGAATEGPSMRVSISYPLWVQGTNLANHFLRCRLHSLQLGASQRLCNSDKAVAQEQLCCTLCHSFVARKDFCARHHFQPGDAIGNLQSGNLQEEILLDLLNYYYSMFDDLRFRFFGLQYDHMLDLRTDYFAMCQILLRKKG